MIARKLEARQQPNNEASCSGDFDGRWARIWIVSAIPRAKNLCWRACRDALPICVNLYKRGVEIDAFCPVCGNDYETTAHILLTVNSLRSTGENLLSDFAPGTEMRRISELGAMAPLTRLIMISVAFLSHSCGAYGS